MVLNHLYSCLFFFLHDVLLLIIFLTIHLPSLRHYQIHYSLYIYIVLHTLHPFFFFSVFHRISKKSSFYSLYVSLVLVHLSGRRSTCAFLIALCTSPPLRSHYHHHHNQQQKEKTKVQEKKKWNPTNCVLFLLVH